MRLIMGGINGHYLRNITMNCAQDTSEVLAAVAYATDASLIFDWCWQHNIPLRFYGRLDDGVAVSVPILTDFLRKKSQKFVCRLVQHHHAKVIWWRGVGVYIGSANLSGGAWYKNVEAGCFFSEEELSDDMASDILDLFATLETNATPLTEELLEEMKRRARVLSAAIPEPKDFWASPSFKKWPGLVQTAPKNAMDRKRQVFLEEWHATLQDLRDIGARISRPENRPAWISESASAGSQADQFLHAHYYQRTFDGRRANYAALFEQNHHHREQVLAETVQWWRQLRTAPSSEDEMLNVTAPYLRAALAEQSLRSMTEEAFRQICMRVHAIKDYARRVPNKAVGLPDGTPYTIPDKVTALSKRIWNDKSTNGVRVNELLQHVLYGGSSEQLPERLWQAVSEPKWKIDGLGISALGELVGWALPDRFPPRNGRTSKALRSLGYDVTVHVE
ncbi:phospholipase D family protein [Bradyrhizobium sp. CW4]|uniref:phospholipase D family protein n=1 Tax=Bradyrhizobium sp. CW4 TaxID=2782687 RepID=UPI001FF774D3|nr:phospholipase D family protein [Bradyrhizobium sp. CW4]MCK1415337.1 phospholipase D family protein [Bradyrhizobium sp. CW4]